MNQVILVTIRSCVDRLCLFLLWNLFSAPSCTPHIHHPAEKYTTAFTLVQTWSNSDLPWKR